MAPTQSETPPAWSLRWAALMLLSVVPVVLTAVFGPQSGLEAMIILLPWLAMLAAHACFGIVALLCAWQERRRWLLAALGVYLIAFAGLHLVWWAVASDIPEKLEAEYLRRYRPADYALEQLPRRPETDASGVAELVAAGADVNRTGLKGWTPLFGAAGGSPELAIALLEAGADPNIPSASGTAPIHLAVRQRQVETVAALLAHGADPDLLDEGGQSALCRVLSQGMAGELAPDRLAMLGFMIEAGVDPNSACPAFVRAVRARQAKSLRMLLDAGHRNEHADDSGIANAFDWATRTRNHAWLELLVEVGADPNRAMRFAIDHSDDTTLELLLEAGADPNAEPYLNRTAGMPKRDELTELLLRYGADPSLADEEGRNALVEAARRAHDENIRRFSALGVDLDTSWRDEPLLLALHTMIPKRKHVPALLVELGADVNVHGNEGHTLLIRATRNSHHQLMKVLVEAGANPDALDDEKRTALHHAAETRFEVSQVVALLLDAGATLEMRDNEGRTALCVAQATGNEPVVTALESRGAAAQECAPAPRSHRIPIQWSGRRLRR